MGPKLFNSFRNDFLLTIIYFMLSITTLALSGCAFMPAMSLDSSPSSQIYESISTVKYAVHVMPLDNQALVNNTANNYHYLLGRGDQVVIYVWGHPEFSSPLGAAFTGDKSPLTTQNSSTINMAVNNSDVILDSSIASYTIDDNGNINIPMVGLIHMENREISSIKDEITRKLSTYIINPQISIRIAGYRSQKVYVLGEVTTPKALYLNDAPLDLAATLLSAGWINLNSADIKNIYVLRLASTNNISVYRLDASSPASMLFANAFILRNNDVVFVSTAGIAQLNRVIMPILNTAQTLWFSTNMVTSTKQVIIQ